MSHRGELNARAILLAALVAFCAPAPGAEKARIYALVSALGSEINLVRQRQGVGSNLAPYQRETLHVPDASVDAAVLRGVDRAVASEDPESQRIFLRLSPAEVAGVLPYKRGEVLAGKVLTALERMPERKDWHRIILLTPRYLNSERDGMGAKLHGIGIYVQPLLRNRIGVTGSALEGTFDPETVSPDGRKSSSYQYVAPYFYAQLWVIDAQTLEVLQTTERYDFQKLSDPDSSALDVAKQIPVERLATLVETFVERAAARALNDAQGEVIIREPRVVDPASTK